MGGGRFGTVMTRYAPGGAEQWSHQLADVRTALAVGSDEASCTAVVINQPEGAFDAVRVGPSGVEWTVRLRDALPREGGRLDAEVRPDGDGGVWIALSVDSQVSDPSALYAVARLGPDGAAAVPFTQQSIPRGEEGLLGLGVTASGAAVLIGNESLMTVVSATGGISVVEKDPGFEPQALGVVGNEVFLVGGADSEEWFARRVALDGQARWTAALGGARLAFSGGADLVVHGDDPYIFIYNGADSRVIRLEGESGTPVWSTSVGAGALFYSIVGDAEGVVVARWVSQTIERTALSSDGDVRWQMSDPTTSTVYALSQCGDGTCLALTASPSQNTQAEIVARGSDGAVAWKAIRNGERGPYTDLYDVAAAPGGVYASGFSRRVPGDDSGPDGGVVVRLSPSGTVQWTAPAGDRMPYTLAVSPEGDVVVGGQDGLAETRRATARRVQADGSLAWTWESADAQSYVAGAIAEAGGGSTVVTAASTGSALVRLGPGGAALSTTLLEGEARLYPLGLFLTPDGYAVASLTNRLELRVDRFGADGTFVVSHAEGQVEGGCTVSPGGRLFLAGRAGDYRSGADASGDVFFVAPFSNGPSSCVGPTLLRFGSEGLEQVTGVGSNSDDTEAFVVRPDGGVAVAQEGSPDWILLQAAPGGEPTSLSFGRLDGTATALSAGPGGEYVAGGVLGDGVPYIQSVFGQQVASPVELPRLDGFAATLRHLMTGSDGEAYAVIGGNSLGGAVSSVVRIDGAVAVSSEARPEGLVPIFAVVGPNPVRAGASLRVRLGMPSTLALYDVLGRRVATWLATSATGEIEIPAVAPGAYILRADAESSASAVPLIVR